MHSSCLEHCPIILTLHPSTGCHFPFNRDDLGAYFSDPLMILLVCRGSERQRLIIWLTNSRCATHYIASNQSLISRQCPWACNFIFVDSCVLPTSKKNVQYISLHQSWLHMWSRCFASTVVVLCRYLVAMI